MSPTSVNNWLGVVSANHVARAVQLGIAQIGHGKRAGLARMREGDRLVYYSPVQQLGDKVPLQAFTATPNWGYQLRPHSAERSRR